MFFPFVLLVVSLVCYVDQELQADITFPDDLQTLCPHTQFCHLKPIETLNSTLSKIKPCCKSCSCSVDCGLKRDCCHSSYDRYNLDEKLGTICKSLSKTDGVIQADEYYYIIDKCPNKIDSCKYKNVSFYGSFFPVYSKMNGMIYYNSHCASCHDQSETVEFLPFITCNDVTDTVPIEVYDVLRGRTNQCLLHFLEPDNLDISHHACNPYLKRHCDVGGTEEQKRKCSSFNATFTRSSQFQNVYCYLCSRSKPILHDDWLERFTKCPVPTNERVFSRSAMSLFLNQKSVDDYSESVAMLTNDHTLCFEHSSKKVCRQIICPEGQIRAKSGCQMFGNSWYLQNIEVYLALTPTEMSNNLTIQHLKRVLPGKLQSAEKEFITRPELQDWDMDLYFNLKEENGTEINFILATFNAYNRMVDPNELLSQMKRALTETWSMTIDNELFYFKADINKFKIYNKVSGTKMYTPLAFADLEMIKNDYIIHAWSSNNLYTRKRGFFISKMFFCEQIKLEKEDFILIENEKIYIHRSMKFLGNAEFAYMWGQTSSRDSVRVCLKDVLPDTNDSKQLEASSSLLYLSFCYIWIKYIILHDIMVNNDIAIKMLVYSECFYTLLYMIIVLFYKNV